MKKVWLFLSILFILTSCGGNKSPLKSYYFPYADFVTPKVYKYVHVKDTTKKMYWRLETGAMNSDTVMSISIYNESLTPVSVFHNKITEDGAQLQSILINTGDDIMLVNAEIKKTESFNWSYQENVPWIVAYNFKNPDGISSQEIFSERNIEKNKQQLVIGGQTYDCIVIKESTLFNEVSNNRTRSEEQQRTSFFAQGVGLVKYETFFANGTSDVFELKEIIIDEDKNTITPVTKDTVSVNQ